ncbi:hypothetical protein H5410_002587 [Solanum commersonii]|uniref:Uncharacterized protein n=1 Tax=Solanum commersonii TaxID=4109 RepID=A0A9J6B2C0_SOLCO|nr:hypothetical protein H5410_002587 [Solanum commersonii]
MGMADLVAIFVMDLAEVQDFKKFMETNSMIGMKCLGRRYTWTNGHIHRKIDWILTNATWLSTRFHWCCEEGMEGYILSYERCMANLKKVKS